MDLNKEEQQAYLKARKRVETVKEFYWNLFSYVVVMPFLVYVNYRTSDYLWFWYPALGWGIGVAFHAFHVFGPNEYWEERKVEEFIGKEEQSSRWK